MSAQHPQFLQTQWLARQLQRLEQRHNLSPRSERVVAFLLKNRPYLEAEMSRRAAAAMKEVG